MNTDETKDILKRYETELTAILDRFSRTREGIHINRNDDPRLRQLVIELRDFLDDALGSNTYSIMIANSFGEGVANLTGSPSYKSVENIRGIVSSVITRLERNPEIISKRSSSVPSPKEPELPERVTLVWLARHVPISFWATLVSLLAAAFVLGIQASHLSLVQEIFGLQASRPSVQEAPKGTQQTEKTKPN